MKRCVIFLASFTATLAVAVAAAAAPQLEVEQSTLDFGAVVQGQKLDLVYKLANRGDEALEIQLRPTCGCTVVENTPRIEPGATEEVHATVDTSDFTGPITKSILVVSNDPERASMRLVARAVVQPILQVLPRPLVRLQTKAGTEASASVILTAVDPQSEPFEITSAGSDSKHLSVSTRALTKDELVAGGGPTQYEISVSLNKDAPQGMVTTPVVVHTTNPKAPELTIKVLAMVTSS